MVEAQTGAPGPTAVPRSEPAAKASGSRRSELETAAEVIALRIGFQRLLFHPRFGMRMSARDRIENAVPSALAAVQTVKLALAVYLKLAFVALGLVGILVVGPMMVMAVAMVMTMVAVPAMVVAVIVAMIVAMIVVVTAMAARRRADASGVFARYKLPARLVEGTIPPLVVRRALISPVGDSLQLAFGVPVMTKPNVGHFRLHCCM